MEPTKVRSFRDLVAWQKAMALAESVYRLCRHLPASEQFCLISQLRRASVGVASCIAEGHGRGSTRDYLRFLEMARGSLNETWTQIELARRLGLAAPSKVQPVLALVEESGRVLQGLINSLQRRTSRG